MTPLLPVSANPIQSLNDIRERGNAFRKAWKNRRGERRKGKSAAPALIKQLQHFLVDIKSFGRRLPKKSERESAQAELDYWATELYLDKALPEGFSDDIGLDAFAPESLPETIKISPFKGLDSFSEQDAAVFVGREKATAELCAKLRDPELRLVIVAAPSGSGKSSLIRAGVVPQLTKERMLGASGTHAHVIMNGPGLAPIEELVAAVLEGAERAPDFKVAVDALESDPKSLASLLQGRFGDKPVILILDQFEELFTLVQSGETREHFARVIASLDPPHKPVIVIRDDFLSDLKKLEPIKDFVGKTANRYALPPLSSEDLRKIISVPASGVVRFEDGVVESLIAEIAHTPNPLPLLQFALKQLVERAQSGWIRRRDVEEIGGVRGALGKKADAIYTALTPDEQEIARAIFIRLATPGGENQFLRRPQTRNWLDNAIRTAIGRGVELKAELLDQVLGKFHVAGLLRRDEDGTSNNDVWYEIRHEALIRHWSTLDGWLKGDLEQYRGAWQLRQWVTLWEKSNRDKGYLLSGDALETANVIVAGSRDPSKAVIAFLDESKTQQRYHRWVRRTGIAAVFFVTFLVVWTFWSMLDAELALQTQLTQIQQIEGQREKQRAADHQRTIDEYVNKVNVALDGLRANNVEPLRSLLRHFKAPDALVNRVSLATGAAPAADTITPLRREDISETAVSALPPPRTSVSGTTTCEAYLWIGGDKNWKVRPPPDSKNVNDDRFELTIPIRLRSDFPLTKGADDYVMRPEIGVAPRGAMITGIGAARGYARPSGEQWWLKAKVERKYCINVFIQYVGPQDRLNEIKAVVTDFGLRILPEEEVASAKGLAEVRYFNQDDRAFAEAIAEQWNRSPRPRQMKPVALLNWKNPPRPGTIEVWIDLDQPG
ncbi:MULTISPECIES: ATP-binding protein [unclassified Bosea (in: a-proteobacteria)]|uniref:ATP-binding protein n=1 Tax=unclassified Bosea (in: a-proteobacteria) TaxID=2653178 RepID=UPI000F76400B|nr:MULTISPECIES: ATP-binding protein [unclassified Bosea (in: a-proteobacteria)]AZO79335.1 hypothetical protein BLM15_18275 [Bosea sp. Tri-49]RXT27252.1 hypothetical protein B5U98_00080 [Bosea sp. Tri-39]RXT36042.1 hypothetical protein B5U99_17920 [Bosea sp. Tri-54]